MGRDDLDRMKHVAKGQALLPGGAYLFVWDHSSKDLFYGPRMEKDERTARQACSR